MRTAPSLAVIVVGLLAIGAIGAQGPVGALAQGAPDAITPERRDFSFPALDAALHWTTLGIEVAGICVIVIGAVWATVNYVRRLLSSRMSDDPFHEYRSSLGKAILLGLEFLVAADIIGTVAIEATLESVMVLGAIVLIRTFLSFSLEVEIEGRLPWQGRQHNGPELSPSTERPRP